MEIKKITKKTVKEAIALVYRAFNNVHGDGHFSEGKVEIELNAQFSKGPYKPIYYGVFKDGKIVSVAGYAQSLFADNTYELRMAATDPEHMKQGHLKKLLLHRMKKIEEELNGEHGLIIMDTYRPEIYYKYGFELIKQSDDFNIMIKEVNGEKS